MDAHPQIQRGTQPERAHPIPDRPTETVRSGWRRALPLLLAALQGNRRSRDRRRRFQPLNLPPTVAMGSGQPVRKRQREKQEVAATATNLEFSPKSYSHRRSRAAENGKLT